MSTARARAAELAALAAFLLLVAVLAAHPLFSIDLFWHLALGEAILDRGAIPTIDLFSAAEPGRPYVQFNWLWEVLAAALVQAGGLRGMRLSQAALMVLSFALLYLGMRRRTGSAGVALVFCAFALVLFEDRFRARPDALSLGLFGATLPWLLAGGAGSALPVLLLGALWSNLHGGTSLLLVLSMGALFAGALVQQRWLERPAALRRSGTQLLAAVFGVALSPALVPGLLHWYRSVQPQMASGNAEWLPTYTMLRNGWHPAFVLVGLGPTLVALIYAVEQARRLRREGRAGVDVPEWLLCAGYLVLAHHAVRNAFLCLLPLAFMLQRHAPRVLASRRNALAAGALALALCAVAFHDAVIVGYGSAEQAAQLLPRDLAPGAYPEAAADFMAEAEIEGGMLNDGRWGGYLIWRTFPRCRVFADSRHHFTAEMWPVFVNSHDPLRRPRALDEAFARWGIELAVFSGPTFPNIAAPPEWVLLFKAGPQEVYQHARGAHAARNFARTQAWLRRKLPELGPDPQLHELGRIAARIGERRWLGEPLQQFRLARAERALRSRNPSEQADGLRARGSLRFTAGAYADAARDFEQAVRLRANDPRAHYQLVLSQLALGEPARARTGIAQLRRLPLDALSPAQRARLAWLQTALGEQAGAAPPPR